MFEILFYVCVFCLVFGVIYHAFAILVYPFYRMIGGKQKFLDYMGSL